MASGISVKLPLTVDETFGAYNLNTNFEQLAKQNLKMLVLTNPGERIMNPDFGVGLLRYLFEMNDTTTYNNLTQRIISQTAKYMTFIRINNVDYSYIEDNPDLFPHALAISIRFTIVPLQISTTLLIHA